jgi:lysophospholipase L1-like esterase
MPIEPSSATSDRRRTLGWARIGCEAAVVLAWLLLVLRYQYGVAWLQPYEVSLDGLFLAAVAGVLLARVVERRDAAAGLAVVLRLAFAAAVTIVALVAAEYALRFQFRRAHSSGNAASYIARRGAQIDPPFRTNGLGFREREIPPKTATRYRIAVVGDSFTWGQGIEEPERFSNVLEQLLGPRYEVLNFGLRGDNMPEHLGVLERALAVSPDFVLLQLYINDFETRSMERPRSYPLLPGSLDRTLEESSLLYDLMQGQWARLQEITGISESYVHYMDRNLRDPNAPNAREAFGQLREFFERAHAAGVLAGAVLFPETDALGPNATTYPFAYLHDGIRRTCEDENVRCLDLLPLFSTFRDPQATWVSPFDAHPNAMANRRSAFEILAVFGAAWQH